MAVDPRGQRVYVLIEHVLTLCLSLGGFTVYGGQMVSQCGARMLT